MMGSLLEAREVVKDFGGLRAVDHCSITVERASICGLIGPNGAGKTTLFDPAHGLLQAQCRFDFLQGRTDRRIGIP